MKVPAPPEKRTDAVLRASAIKLPELSREYHALNLTQAEKSKVFFETPLSKWVRSQSNCKHSATVIVRMPVGHVHFTSEHCADCGRHLRWLPKPETIERQKLNGFRLAKLAMCDGLTTWERAFIRDISKRRKLSPRQQQIVDRLCADYLKTDVAL